VLLFVSGEDILSHITQRIENILHYPCGTSERQIRPPKIQSSSEGTVGRVEMIDRELEGESKMVFQKLPFVITTLVVLRLTRTKASRKPHN
jgi:hypothetical protein